MVIPCIHYGAETWNCSWKEISKLNGIQYRQLRTILGKNWLDKISHVDILHSVKFGTNQNFNWALPDDETKTPDLKPVETMIRLSRLRYTGHVLRMDNTRLPKILLNGEINSKKRKVGRPQQNFRSYIKEDLKLFKIWNESPQFGSTQLPELTSNRAVFRAVVNEFAPLFSIASKFRKLC